MTRPLRIEFCGALYHVTARGDRQEAIYEDDEDRRRFLAILGEIAEGWNWGKNDRNGAGLPGGLLT